jgi:hypothetical protein
MLDSLQFRERQGFMADYRLKIKIGEHEFDAEGPVETVQAQFEAFKELVSAAPLKTQPSPMNAPDNADQPNGDPNELNLEKITRVEGRIISLTIGVDRIPDAILLILLGQRRFRSNDAVTGAEILEGLRESGRPIDRADRILLSLHAEGLLIAVGQHRSRTYRLTNAGVARAQEIARNMISLVP